MEDVKTDKEAPGLLATGPNVGRLMGTATPTPRIANASGEDIRVWMNRYDPGVTDFFLIEMRQGVTMTIEFEEDILRDGNPFKVPGGLSGSYCEVWLKPDIKSKDYCYNATWSNGKVFYGAEKGGCETDIEVDPKDQVGPILPRRPRIIVSDVAMIPTSE